VALSDESVNALSPVTTQEPFTAADLASAAAPLDRFLCALGLVERTVLPRTLTLETDAARLSLDVTGQRLALLPRRDNHYAIDDQLAADARKAHKVLRKRAPAARRSIASLPPPREALAACAARTLWAFCLHPGADCTVQAIAPEDATAEITFSAADLYEAARPGAPSKPDGPAAAFYGLMKSRADIAWRATREGWVLDHAGAGNDRSTLARLVHISRSARRFAHWLAAAGMSDGPTLSFLSGGGYRVIRCVTVDRTEIAYLTLSPSAWAGALQAWETIRADPARIAPHQEQPTVTE